MSKTLVAGLFGLGLLALGGGAFAMPVQAKPEASPDGEPAPTPPEAPERPPVTFLQARYFTPGPVHRTINRIVIHITDGNADSARKTAQYFATMNDGRQASAHYVCGPDGIYQCVKDNDIAWHAIGANQDSIGIENQARTPNERGPNDPGVPVSEENYLNTASLVRWLCWQYAIPMDREHILGHNEVSQNHPDCPTGQWDWNHFMGVLNNA